jgi:argininosuccinate lyase
VSEIELSDLQTFSKLIDKDIFSVLTLEGSINSRDHPGGTAPSQVAAAIKLAKKWLT